MSNAASHAHAFYRQVARDKKVWTVKDAGGFPAPKNAEGQRAQPFWSSISRVERIIKRVPAYAGFVPHEIPWETFRDRWLPGLQRDGILIGVNWSGERAKGYDLDSEWVRKAIELQLENQEGEQIADGKTPEAPKPPN